MRGGNPYRLQTPATVSFSGGRTSGYMLWHILDAFDGELPDDIDVCFSNTGREHPKTLDFVQRCASEWGVRITWLEYTAAEKPADRFQVVSHNSASRDGAPFEALIRKRKMLPNPKMRFCTQELKLHTMRRYVGWRHGWKRWTNAVGLRADEPMRVARLTQRCGTGKDPYRPYCPLHAAGVAEHDVLAWWEAQPFDLEIPRWLGNCDMCFLKSKDRLIRAMQDEPERAQWWVDIEEQMGSTFLGKRLGGRGHQGLLDLAEDDSQMGLFDDLEWIECACTD